MQEFKIALYPGDGIGLEVTPEAVKALRAVEPAANAKFVFTELEWGIRYWNQHGIVVPEDYLTQLRAFDAIFLGAIGWPELVPDHISLVPLISIRQTFDQYACIRPCKLLPGVETPLAGRPEIDFVIVRENSEGEYVDSGGIFHRDSPEEVALQTSVHTRRGIERILRYGFKLAQSRRKKLTMATKSNALKNSMVLWDRVFAEVRKEFPDVESDKAHIDALSMYLIQAPSRYDVIVASNLFGDILSDLGGGLVGSLGLTPSANINPERTSPSLFEPVHGSAPDIAGRGLANPVAAVRSAALMLEFLGCAEAARAIESGVDSYLADAGPKTKDLGGTANTSAAGDAIVAKIRRFVE
ncbi:MAG: tartrate dehydrogenase [Spirochaetaceae bacterium]|nr:MAG: tartrate dehydrogenase [Spirochaetaceae bacterium]